MPPSPGEPCKQRGRFWAISFLAVTLLAGCASAPKQSEHSGDHKQAAHATSHRHRAAYNRPYAIKGRTYVPMDSAKGYKERGLASWYGWESGNRTATGAHFDPRRLTAAHRTLPLPTRVRVTNLRNRRAIDVLVNDRGPFVTGRIIDLSQGAARALKIDGVVPVEVRAID
ncbi:septal ring lytic transglycosylase RlpA family protein [Methyloterricola oryzae]|uniref:septal ring lytic transglycosylase RlpA family protein n=1 Tax=Methyloterricola oryzae TaxID=1495050 RepID=UPI0005EAD171|nr:septal ring lytic transglycosylase RlpA family protein [Methyloterricola oryzae]